MSLIAPLILKIITRAKFMNMKKIYVIIILSLASINWVNAQRMELSLNLNDFSRANHSISGSGALIEYSKKFTVLLPAIGITYFHKNTTGIGFQIGYWQTNAKENLLLMGRDSTEIQKANNSNTSKYLTFQFSVQENLAIGNYIFSPALAIPCTILLKGHLTNTQVLENKYNSNEIFYTYQSEELPLTLDWGVYFKPTISRKILNKLYLGLTINTGLQIFSKLGKGRYSTTQYDYGQKSYENSYVIKYQKSHAMDLNIFPSFSLIYQLR